MQRYDPRGGVQKSPNTTYALAQFLATTGPDHQAVSFADYVPAQPNKKNLFDRLRKKTSYANTKYVQQQQESFPARPIVHRKYIPLADDINQPYRYYQAGEDTSSNDIPSFPTPPASSLHESTSTLEKKPGTIRGLRHIQVQTEDHFPIISSNNRCTLCCRPLNRMQRRASSPAVLPSGAKIKLGQEATLLLALIDQLKQQLAEEQQSRKILEKAIQLQWADKNNP